ncbi:hypothetical protein [Desulfovibrio sp. TomC]|uniref:hypothetical protein n=1 Tax=Desulfovibrio sp. TomC TaxID=1562888 RepID=UPI0012E20AC3|nr:hypothetical protein [Desulfovibrio sp. TomC]
MKTRHASRFVREVQGKPAASRRVAAIALALLVATALLAPRPASADGMSSPSVEYGPPPAAPSDSAWDNNDEPRRDVRLGNVDHMRLGREEDGSVIMEIRPRPKPTQDQSQTGPIYVYPQIGNMPGQQTGQQAGSPSGPQSGQPRGQIGQPGSMPQPGQPSQGRGMAGGPSGQSSPLGQPPGQSQTAPGNQGNPGNFGPTGNTSGFGQSPGSPSGQRLPTGQGTTGSGS